MISNPNFDPTIPEQPVWKYSTRDLKVVSRIYKRFGYILISKTLIPFYKIRTNKIKHELLLDSTLIDQTWLVFSSLNNGTIFFFCLMLLCCYLEIKFICAHIGIILMIKTGLKIVFLYRAMIVVWFWWHFILSFAVFF